MNKNEFVINIPERCSKFRLQDRNTLFLIVHRNDDRNCGRIRRMDHRYLITAASDNFDIETPAKSVSPFRSATLRLSPPAQWIEMLPVCCEVHVPFLQP